MSALGCADVLPHLESYRRGDTSRELALLVDEHLARCPECRRQLAHLKQVTAMLSAWRPMPAPVDLKIETAEAIGEELGGLARRMFPRVRRRRRPRRPGRSAMSTAQRVANALAVAALAFLAAAILWRLWSAHYGRPSAPGGVVPAAASPGDAESVYHLTLIRPGPPEREPELIRLVREVTGAGLQEAEQIVNRLPVTIRVGPDEAAAERIRARFESLGAGVELSGPSPGVEP